MCMKAWQPFLSFSKHGKVLTWFTWFLFQWNIQSCISIIINYVDEYSKNRASCLFWCTQVIKFEVHVCCYLCSFRDLFWNTCLDVFVHEVSNSQSHNYCLNIALDPYSKQKNLHRSNPNCVSSKLLPFKSGMFGPLPAPISKHLISQRHLISLKFQNTRFMTIHLVIGAIKFWLKVPNDDTRTTSHPSDLEQCTFTYFVIVVPQLGSAHTSVK